MFVCKSNEEKNEKITVSMKEHNKTINEKLYVFIFVSFFVSLAKYPAEKPATVLDSIDKPSRLPEIKSTSNP